VTRAGVAAPIAAGSRLLTVRPWTNPLRRILNTLAGRLAVLQLGIHLVLVPLLLFRLGAVVRENTTGSFTRHAHAYARALAHELEVGDVLLSPSRTVFFLDSVVRGGACAYAAIDYGGRLIGSSLADTPAWIRRRGNDPTIRSTPDHAYAVSEAIDRDGTVGALYLGFDTGPTMRQIRTAWAQMLFALIVYAVVSIAAAVAVARLVSRPLTGLQRASRRAAQGDPAERIDSDSGMVEIVELTRDLEFMRSALVGTAGQLRAEMRQREAEQAERAALENRLRHEQRLATVGTFASGLTHEFNNILLPMLLLAEEALEDIDVEHRSRGNIEKILALTVRANDVISKMLAFSRPSEHRRHEPFDPAATLAETLDLCRVLVPSTVELHVEILPCGLLVVGDATQFSQVILNLFSNAVYAMRGGGGTLSARLAPRVAARDGAPRTDAVELRIKDDGVGMSPELRDHIFEPFFTTRGVGEGTGLGLSVVHGIVAGMGGSIEVITATGQGAEFVIVLPGIARPAQT
jgi:signal transduction histidine kinase